MSHSPEESLSSKLIFQGRVVTLQEDQVRGADGQPTTREVMRHPGGVCVMPILPTGDFLLIRQYRYALGEWILEFPAGKLDVKGEALLDAIKRELWEETGYEASDWKACGFIFTAPGFCDEKIWLYQANDLTKVDERSGNSDESIELLTMSPDEAKDAVLSGDITDAKTLALLNHYFLAN